MLLSLEMITIVVVNLFCTKSTFTPGIYFSGTFAVISLMVGSVVDKGMKSQGLEPMSWNMTVSTGTNVTYEIMDNSAELLDMKLKLAMSVTFAVGAIQVIESICCWTVYFSHVLRLIFNEVFLPLIIFLFIL